MKSLLRWLVSIFIMLGTLLLSNCSPYGCRVTFGNSTCTSSGTSGFGGGGGSGGGGGGNGTPAVYAYAVDEAGTIDGYTLTSGSSPSFGATSNFVAPTIPTNSEGSGMVIAQGVYLYAAFPGTGQIYGWTIGSGGTLTAINGSPFSAPYLIGEPAGGLWGMITNPAGTLLFMVDTSGLSVHVYQIVSGGALTQVSGSPFSVPFFPGNLGTDGLGKYLYVVDNINSTEIAAFSISSTGTLTTVPGSPFSFPMGQVQGDASGQYLIGIQSNNFGFNDLYVFSIMQSGTNAGALAVVPGSPVATTYVPYSFAVQPSSGGTLVYSFSATSIGYNPIEGYQLNTSNGGLTVLNQSPFTGVSNGFWGQFDQSGANLFVFGDVSNGTTGAPYIGALSVGSGGVLTQSTSQLNLATLGFWAVTDPN